MKEIPLTQGQYALVDDEDYDYLMQWKWCASKQGRSYCAVRAYRRQDGARRLIYMHREIMRAEPCEQVDHINGDQWDNRKINMRIATNAQNSRNQRKRVGIFSSQYKGVYWAGYAGKWRARVKLNGKTRHLGYFDSELDAALAYDKAARGLFGEFVRTNFKE